MDAQHPSLIVETKADGDTWVECRDCGRCNYLSKGQIMHGRRCTAKAQYSATPVAAPAVKDDDAALRQHAANVRRTGLTLGRDEETYEAVRRGHLSMSAAMNTDD